MKDEFYIEFVDFLGEIRNDTLINGKAFIFKLVDLVKTHTFEVILFVHQSVPAFLTINDEDYKILEADILKEILSQFNINELLNFKKDEN